MYFILMCTQSYAVPDSEHLGRVGYKRSNGSIRIKTPFYLEASRQPGREKLTGGVLTALSSAAFSSLVTGRSTTPGNEAAHPLRSGWKR